MSRRLSARKKTVISLLSISKSSSDKSRAGTAGIREQYHIITVPASSAVQRQHRKAPRRQRRPTGLCHQSLRSSTTANQGERAMLDSHALLTPRDSARLMTRPFPAARTISLPSLFLILKNLEICVKESPRATEHPQPSCSRTANNQAAVYWEEPSTAVGPDTDQLWRAVLGQSLKQQADNNAVPRKRTVIKVCRHQD